MLNYSISISNTEAEGNSERFREQAKVTKIGSRSQTLEGSQPTFVLFVAFCSFFPVIARCQQIAEETAGKQEDNACCAA